MNRTILGNRLTQVDHKHFQIRYIESGFCSEKTDIENSVHSFVERLSDIRCIIQLRLATRVSARFEIGLQKIALNNSFDFLGILIPCESFGVNFEPT